MTDVSETRWARTEDGARIGALAGPFEVLVSSTVKDFVPGSGLVLEDRGEHPLKGVPEPRRLHDAVASGNP